MSDPPQRWEALFTALHLPERLRPDLAALERDRELARRFLNGEAHPTWQGMPSAGALLAALSERVKGRKR